MSIQEARESQARQNLADADHRLEGALHSLEMARTEVEFWQNKKQRATEALIAFLEKREK